MEVDNAIFQGLGSCEKREVFSNWLWNSFGFLFGEILKYPEMDNMT